MENNKCRLVIIGGSAGSIDVLIRILPRLQLELPFAIVIVLHRKSSSDSFLGELFGSRTLMPVTEIEDKNEIEPGHIYIAPPDYHLLFEINGAFCLDDSEKVNYSRPSIDVAFESAADVYKGSLAAILLSGANSDGSNGLGAVKSNGGITAVQQPDNAEVSFMPQQAILNAPVDYILETDHIPDFINRLAGAN